eukprot:scaffold154050_cov21-Tisochrysis_lutea.AAC.1
MADCMPSLELLSFCALPQPRNHRCAYSMDKRCMLLYMHPKAVVAKAALRLSPGSALLSMLLCHIYVVSGKMRLARQVARAAVEATPADMDAHMLCALLQQLAEQVQQEDGQEEEDWDEDEEEGIGQSEWMGAY